MADPLEYRRLRAPTGDGEVMMDPPVSESVARIAENLRIAAARRFQFAGQSIQNVASEARARMLDAALIHTRGRAGDVIPNLRSQRIYLVGHQPELFHPGVWLKNFVLDRLAKRDGAVALHVLIDNDLAGEPTIAVPTGSPEKPEIAQVAFDRSSTPLPWEERTLIDAEMFRTAGDRIATTTASLIEKPLARDVWNNNGKHASEGDNLGQLLAEMRHSLEQQWGLNTWEVPLSKLCQDRSFRWFVALMLSRLPDLHEIHNQTLSEYRQLHHLRSDSRPIPDLEKLGETYETPFWLWTTADPRRRKLFARHAGEEMELTDGEGFSLSLPNPTTVPGAFIAELARLEGEGAKIRPRALMTTMYLRVFLSDWFIHGIGGAKYDQITDRLIEALFGFEPPAYMTVTGTRLLPVQRSPTATTIHDIDRALRDLEFHPEKHLPPDLSGDAKRQADSLLAEKQSLLQAGNDINGRQRHAALQRINAALQPFVANSQRRLEAERQQSEQNVHARELLDCREFSFCLFPEESLRPWLLDAAAQAS